MSTSSGFVDCPSTDSPAPKRSGLLRLIQSDLFDVSMAVGYLMRYEGDECVDGIRFAICERILTMSPPQKVYFFIPQLCHLFVTAEKLAAPLEYLLLELCFRSLHVSILTLWYLENYLHDFSSQYSKYKDFYLRTARLLHNLHKSLFKDRNWDYYAAINSPIFTTDFEGAIEKNPIIVPVGQDRINVPKLSASILGSAIGWGGMFMGEFGQKFNKAVLVEAGQYDLVCRRKCSWEKRSTHSRNDSATLIQDKKTINGSVNSSSPDQLASFSLKTFMKKAAQQFNSSTTPTLMILSNSFRSSYIGERLFSTPMAPSIPLYYFAEMQFILSLIDISSRLVLIPRDGRRKALIADLSLINHNLPSNICIPLWCNEHGNEESLTAGATAGGSSSHQHFRILRTCPSEAVVLNSAERAPFIFYLEILNDPTMSDADFAALCAYNNNTKSSSYPPSNNVSFVNTMEESLDPLEGSSPTLNDEELNEMEALVEDPSILEGPLSSDDFSERMRTAAIMLAQLTRSSTSPNCSPKRLLEIGQIREKIIKEMEQLEKNRLFDALQGTDTTSSPPRDPFVMDQRIQFDREDPSSAVFQEDLNFKIERIRKSSPFGHLEGWNVLPVIVKSGSDMRQEQLACQLISEMTSIWRLADLPLWTYCYRVLVASSGGGLIETVPNSISLHSIKKSAYFQHRSQPNYTFSLRDHFITIHGSPDSDTFKAARDCFIHSLAAYSIVTYFLQVKDRHDGNILLDRQGHLIHIDFGFMLSNSPGYVGFESAPFKLSPEYIELLGGSLQSPEFIQFKELIFQGIAELRKHHERILVLVEALMRHSTLPCFYSGETALSQIKQRLHLHLTDGQLRQVVDRLVISSAFNVFTKLYDTFQYYSQGIF